MEGSTKFKLLLNPMDRVAEILFGLIMALSFTCSIGIANQGADRDPATADRGYWL